MADVERRDELLPQSESAIPDKPSSTPERWWYVSLKLGKLSRYSIRWCRAAQLDGPAEAQNRASVDTVKDISNLIHDAANYSLATKDRQCFCLRASGYVGQSSLLITKPGDIGTRFGHIILVITQNLLNVVIKVKHAYTACLFDLHTQESFHEPSSCDTEILFCILP
jgi:hypothetical protein